MTEAAHAYHRPPMTRRDELEWVQENGFPAGHSVYEGLPPSVWLERVARELEHDEG